MKVIGAAVGFRSVNEADSTSPRATLPKSSSVGPSQVPVTGRPVSSIDACSPASPCTTTTERERSAPRHPGSKVTSTGALSPGSSRFIDRSRLNPSAGFCSMRSICTAQSPTFFSSTRRVVTCPDSTSPKSTVSGEKAISPQSSGVELQALRKSAADATSRASRRMRRIHARGGFSFPPVSRPETFESSCRTHRASARVSPRPFSAS